MLTLHELFLSENPDMTQWKKIVMKNKLKTEKIGILNTKRRINIIPNLFIN